MGAVGVVGQDPGVIEPDPALSPCRPGGGQRRELAGDVGAGPGGVAGDAGVLPEPGRGVPEVVPAFGPQDFDLDEQVGFFGIEAVPAFLEPSGPVRQRRRILGEQVLVGAGGGR